MRNIAKCKLCQTVIESFHSTDYVMCKCGEIAVDKGEGMWCIAKDFNNFLRVDDEGNEIVVRFMEDVKPSKDDLLKMLQEMIISYEKLPQEAKFAPIVSADILSVLYLMQALHKD